MIPIAAFLLVNGLNAVPAPPRPEVRPIEAVSDIILNLEDAVLTIPKTAANDSTWKYQPAQTPSGRRIRITYQGITLDVSRLKCVFVESDGTKRTVTMTLNENGTINQEMRSEAPPSVKIGPPQNRP